MRVFVCLLVASACLLVPGSGRSVKGGSYSYSPLPPPPPPKHPQAPSQPVEAETNPEETYVTGGYDLEGATDESDDGDDVNKDPDWVPDSTEDYDEEDHEYEYRDDEEYDEDEDDYGVYDDEDDLWSSDDDPDYEPTDQENEDEDDLWSSDDDPDYEPTDQEKYELAVEELTDILISSLYLSDPESETPTPSREEVEKMIRDRDPSLEELILVLSQIRSFHQIQVDSQQNLFSTEDHSHETDPHSLETDQNSLETDHLSQENDPHSIENALLSLENSDETFPEPNFLPSGYSSSKDADYNAKGRKKRSVPTQQENWVEVEDFGQSRQSQYSNQDVDQYQNQDLDQYQNQNQNLHQSQSQDQYQNQNDNYRNQYPDVSVGVEPLIPIEGPQEDDVRAGVEPAGEVNGGGYDGEEADRPSFFGWLQRGREKLSHAVDNLGDYAEDKFDEWGDKLSDAGQTIHQAATHAADKVQEVAQQAGDSIVDVYHDVREKLPELKDRLVLAFGQFGILVQDGAKYCIQRLTHMVDQVRGSEILDKLEQKMTEGNAQVAQFFQLLGQKISSWKANHLADNVDEGLVIVQVEGGQQGGYQEGGSDHGDFQQGMPDFFQEDDVILQLHKLVDIGVLTQEDLEVLSQDHYDQQSQQQGQRYVLE